MQRIETPSAILERASPDLVVCRYKPHVKLTAAAVQENLEARKQYLGEAPYAVLGTFPDDVDYDMSLLELDHYTDIAVNQVTHVLAIVANQGSFEPIAKLYFAYHPTSFLSKVFATEQEALGWIDQQIAQRVQRA